MENLLPCDGIAIYHGLILGDEEQGQMFATLRGTIAWEHDEIVMFGKRIVTAREVAWHGDGGVSYAYSGTTKHAKPWTPALLELKSRVEEVSGATYNSCLLNLYHDGSEGMGWHSDDERTLEEYASIASVSLGVDRRFSFKHKRTKETRTIMLEKGSLLVMAGATQKHWLHQLPKARRVEEARINLTFRTMGGSG